MFAKSYPNTFISILLTISALIIGSLATKSTPAPSPAPVVYAVPQPSLQTDSLASSIDSVPISGQCIISILHNSETGGPVVPVSQESNSFKDCGVSPSFITSTTTTTGSTSTVTTTSTMGGSLSSDTASPLPPSDFSSSASIVSSTSSAATSAPAGSNAGSPQFSSIQSFAISIVILPCILAFALQLL
ncbi:uncharacterized protein FA14DRAFT_190831 [Meira miltonrushii]|uniref:Uncharacterized protein n=1 Tax=Meira miltonrushii TaxID=1280837 RepID=A0A316VBS1_9BASI|nr:uncharacterized protein FA14DRAFT_190831 [Meira miltonrushii]PWN33703.1 hypothetical protein FA14DRAFT_190831 [Meira miltonrushii]